MPAKTTGAKADLALLENLWRDAPGRIVLPNGLTVLLKRDDSAALASVQVWVKSGSIHENEHLGSGLSHFLEHMLFKGTATRTGRELAASVQAHGGCLNAYTTFDRTVYHLDLPSEHTGLAIELLADATLHSTLPADEVAKEREVILREIDMGEDDPDHRLAETLFDTAFREHPYRHPIIGHRAVFESVTRADLAAYYAARYAPNNLVVVVAGAFDPAATPDAIARHFGKTPRRSLAPLYIPDEPPPLARREQHRFEDVQVSRAILAWPIPGLAHPDAPVLDLLAMILGHGDSSILWQEVREKARLVHSIEAASWNPGSAGLFHVSFTAEAARRAGATAAVEHVLARCAVRGFEPGLIAKAIRQIVVGAINARKTMNGQASLLGAAEVVVGDLNYEQTYFARLRAVTPVDLKRALRAYVVSDRLTVVSLNPAASAPASAVRKKTRAAADDFTEEKLPNGARLLLQRNSRLPNLHLRLLCLGGPPHERTGRRGATALLANLLTKDTGRRTSAEVARTIEAAGGSFYDFSGNNSFGLAVEVLPGDAGLALALLADAVLAPAFKPATFAIERAAHLAELRQDEDEVVTFACKLVRRKFFGGHPLAIGSEGDPAGIRALVVDDLRKLHRKLVVAGNLVLAAAGDFDQEKLAPRLRAFLQKLPPGAPAAPSAHFAAPAHAGEFVETQPRQQAVVCQAYPSPGLLAPDYYVSEVAEELFSGLSSQLFERVREQKSLAYFVRATRVVGLKAGMFLFFSGASPGRFPEVVVELNLEVARVQSGGVTPEELLRCQTRLKAARRMGLQTNGARAMQAGLNALYGQPVNDWKTCDARIEAVTLDDLARFARTYFQAAGKTQLVVKP